MKKHILFILFIFIGNPGFSQVWKKGRDASGFPSVKLAQSSKFIFNLSSKKDAVYIQKSDDFGSSWMDMSTINGSEPGVTISLDILVRDTLVYVLCELHPKTISLVILGESGKQLAELKVAENTSANPKTDHLFFINKELWISCMNGIFKYDFKKKLISQIHHENCKDLLESNGKLFKISTDGTALFSSADKGKNWVEITKGLEEHVEYLQIFNFTKELAVISKNGLWLWKSGKWEKLKDLVFSPQKVLVEGKLVFIYSNDKFGLSGVSVYSDYGAKFVRSLSVPPGFMIQHMLYHKDSLLALVDWICYRIQLPAMK
jgi:hypothetical protein